MLDVTNTARSDGERKQEVAFLIEEYKNIASTHDRLRDELGRLFNYFMLLSAFPFTVAGIMFRQGDFNFLAAPQEIHILCGIVGFGHLFLALSIVHARRRQYEYARTVNLIRKYFADDAPSLRPYLLLPISGESPSYAKLGHLAYQVTFMILVGSIFVTYSVFGIVPHEKAIYSSVAAFVLYWVIYRVFKGKIQRQ
jgi:hypothetical protein